MNDLGDRVKDRIAGRARPIAQGLVPAGCARLVAILLMLGAGAIDWHLGCRPSHVVLLIVLTGVAAYTPLAHVVPVAKGAMTALLCLAPLSYGAAVTNAAFPMGTYVTLVVFVLGRELLLDVRDMSGDRAYGLKTLPCYIGPTNSIAVAFVLMGAAGAAALFVVVGSGGRFLSALALAAVTVSCACWARSSATSILVSRIALLLGGLAIATTAGSM